ncbi:hypothetical protein H8356DRAFT_1080789 [Neocallimastix lanati (nom. inval.)]|nr:hypothetical protein H8356DRAFT_1080789 [Neocallimastix sp. JGI-2020a]
MENTKEPKNNSEIKIDNEVKNENKTTEISNKLAKRVIQVKANHYQCPILEYTGSTNDIINYFRVNANTPLEHREKNGLNLYKQYYGADDCSFPDILKEIKHEVTFELVELVTDAA